MFGRRSTTSSNAPRVGVVGHLGTSYSSTQVVTQHLVAQAKAATGKDIQVTESYDNTDNIFRDRIGYGRGMRAGPQSFDRAVGVVYLCAGDYMTRTEQGEDIKKAMSNKSMSSLPFLILIAADEGDKTNWEEALGADTFPESANWLIATTASFPSTLPGWFDSSTITVDADLTEALAWFIQNALPTEEVKADGKKGLGALLGMLHSSVEAKTEQVNDDDKLIELPDVEKVVERLETSEKAKVAAEKKPAKIKEWLGTIFGSNKTAAL